ncbi:PIG-L deacetylase family protein [Fodinicola acaciae]|uniref:PIG-L deacetylase family protein n=1 Tax=Fodinicola acaciae TaxID=2681555 RepID=UPI0013D2F1ED|nr:PIG-L deacetylase family protein [Fodinicola acaciae]
MSIVAVLAAHPDDELLGPGGTLALWVRRGDDVHAIIVADGATSRYEHGMASVLAKSSRRAGDVLGLSSVRDLALPDQRLDAIPLIDVTQRIEAVVDELRPDIVLTHFPQDVNADHCVVARATWTACRPYVLPRLKRFAVFETPSSTEWAWPADAAAFAPTVFVDISETLEDKLAAMECYESELRDYPHPRSLRALRERAGFWGSRIGRAAAEPFQLLREVT